MRTPRALRLLKGAAVALERIAVTVSGQRKRGIVSNVQLEGTPQQLNVPKVVSEFPENPVRIERMESSN